MKLLALSLIALLASATVLSPRYVPATDTAIATSLASLTYMHLNNKSAGTVTCVVKDRSTNCGGGVCSLWGPAPLGASGAVGSIVAWDFHGISAPSGFTWSCDTAGAVVGSIIYQ